MLFYSLLFFIRIRYSKSFILSNKKNNKKIKYLIKIMKIYFKLLFLYEQNYQFFLNRNYILFKRNYN